MPILEYRQQQGRLPAGALARGSQSRGLPFLNPRNPQVDEITITTGSATVGWTIGVSNDDTGESAPLLSFDPAGASTAEAATALLNAWNASPANLKFARAVLTSASVVELRYSSDRFAFTSVVVPAGAGAETTVVTAESGFSAFYGHWAFRTLTAGIVTTADGRTLVNPIGSNVLENVAGIVIRVLAQNENPDLARTQTDTRGRYRPGAEVPCLRLGNIMVPVTVAVKPGDDVRAIIAGADAGKTTNTGGLDLSSIADFISLAAAGENAEIQITLS